MFESADLVFSQKDALLNTTVGNLVHAVFEQMVNEDLSLWNTQTIQQRLPVYQQWLSQQGLADEQMTEALRRVEKSLQHAIDNADFKWALQTPHLESATEFPLTSIEGDVIANHIIDRTFVDNQGQRWIVDYKTSVYDGSNEESFIQKQLEKYKPQLQLSLIHI